jgi:hypothetical protein
VGRKQKQALLAGAAAGSSRSPFQGSVFLGFRFRGFFFKVVIVKPANAAPGAKWTFLSTASFLYLQVGFTTFTVGQIH